MQTDVEKTLEILKAHGSKGIHSFHLGHLVGTIRAAARIADLKKLGHVIESKYEKIGTSWGVRYTLKDQEVKSKRVKYEFDDKTKTVREVYI